MKRLFLILFFFIGCGGGTHSSTNEKEPTYENNDTSKVVCVDVFTLGPLKNISIVDSNNSFAEYNLFLNKYCFNKQPTYPIKLIINPSSYVDINYNNKKDSTDVEINPFIQKHSLRSFCNHINILTDIFYDSYLPLYQSESNESNVSNESNESNESNVSTKINIATLIDNYKSLIKQKYNTDVCNPSYKLLFAVYNYLVEHNNTLPKSLDDLDEEYSKIDNLFNTYPIMANKKYYSAYHSLELLDKRVLKRVDTIHKPLLPSILGIKDIVYDKNYNIHAFDIKIDNNLVHIAAGQDEYAVLEESNFSNYYIENSIKPNSFGSKIYIQNKNNNKCIYIAANKAGLAVFNNLIKRGYIDSYISSQGEITKFASNIINVKIYNSVNKDFLAILTDDKGLYLINKNNFYNCYPKTTLLQKEDKNITTLDINETRDFLINEQQGKVYDIAFSSDGAFLFESNDKGISRYSLESLDFIDILNSKTDFNINAYTLKLFKQDTALVVSNEKGISIFNVLNNKDLFLNSNYISEGAQKDYIATIKIYKDYIIFSDGYYGIKVLKLDSNLNPMLCGVRYFGLNSKLAKVKSFDIDKNYLIVGLSYGIEKIKIDDIIFAHCR